jgi:8-oxo-dGTP pyrophosphatase MutT (NUDIX family)
MARALKAGRRDSHRSDVATAKLIAEQQGKTIASLPPETKLVPAAVLVPLVSRPDGLSVLLTQRTPHLIHHGGQISFPGGRMESGDASPEAAALRETEEEIGLKPALVDLLGRLDDYVTVTGFHVVPVVGLLQPPLALIPDPFEVAEVFEVPLRFVMDPANHQRRSRITDQGVERFFYALPYEGRTIWGATAAMLVNLYEILAELWSS